MGPEDQLNREEFITLLLIYAAHADYSFSEIEKEFILSVSNEDTYSAMFDLFNNRSDFEILKILVSNRTKYFNSQEEREKILSVLRNQFKNDGDRHNIEEQFIHFFDRMSNAL